MFIKILIHNNRSKNEYGARRFFRLIGAEIKVPRFDVSKLGSRYVVVGWRKQTFNGRALHYTSVNRLFTNRQPHCNGPRHVFWFSWSHARPRYVLIIIPDHRPRWTKTRTITLCAPSMAIGSEVGAGPPLRFVRDLGRFLNRKAAFLRLWNKTNTRQ